MPGRIHVSEDFRDLALTAFRFEDRGTTNIKSIGVTRTFFLIGESGDEREADSAELTVPSRTPETNFGDRPRGTEAASPTRAAIDEKGEVIEQAWAKIGTLYVRKRAALLN